MALDPGRVCCGGALRGFAAAGRCDRLGVSWARLAAGVGTEGGPGAPRGGDNGGWGGRGWRCAGDGVGRQSDGLPAAWTERSREEASAQGGPFRPWERLRRDPWVLSAQGPA